MCCESFVFQPISHVKSAEVVRESIEREVHDGNREKRQQLTHCETSNDRDAERVAEFRSNTAA
jgi:hypothetical protein